MADSSLGPASTSEDAPEPDAVDWLAEIEREVRGHLARRTSLQDDAPQRRLMELTVGVLVAQAQPSFGRLAPVVTAAIEDYEERRADLVRLVSTESLPADDARPLVARLDAALLAAIRRQRTRLEQLRQWSAGAAIVAVLTWVVGAWAWLSAADDGDRTAQLWTGVGVQLLGAGATSVLVAAAGAAREPLRRRLLLGAPIAVVAVAVAGLLTWVADGPRGSTELSSALVVLAGGLLLLLANVRGAGAVATVQPVDGGGRGLLGQATEGERPEGRLLAVVGREIVARGDDEASQARGWQWMHLLVGGAASAASGAAAAVVNVGDNQALVTVLAVLGALLSGVVTAVNPGRRFEVAHAVAQMCSALSREVMILLRADFRDFQDLERREALEDVVDRFEKAIGVTGRDGFWRRRSSRPADAR